MWFFGLIVVVLIGAVAVVASGRWGAMSTAYDDRPDMTVPARQALTSDDIETARFAVGLRGYRMDEVDTLLERVAREVAERDRRIADLERAVAPIVEAPDGARFTSRGRYDPADFDDTGTQQPILVGGDFPEPPPTHPAEAAALPEPDPADAPTSAAPTSAAPVSAATAELPVSAATAEVPEPDASPVSATDRSEPPAPAADLPEPPAPAAGPVAQPSAEPVPQSGAQPAETVADTPHANAAADAAATSVEPARSGPSTGADPVTAEQLAALRAAPTDEEPDTQEVAQSTHAEAANEYERLQAEARALLEAQTHPTPSRQTPPPPPETPDQHPDAPTERPEPPAPTAPTAQGPQQPESFSQQATSYT
ncbi:DivIVA domain-containing protein [Kribbella sp. NPDC055071]